MPGKNSRFLHEKPYKGTGLTITAVINMYLKKDLMTDEDFRNLKHPLFPNEYKQLEASILTEGCLSPILTWKGFIVDGHNRYEICKRHGIPFRTEEVFFECKEEAMAWICAEQLGRRNITEETRKFLIGLQYENEKIANNRKVRIRSESGKVMEILQKADQTNRKTAHRIAEENHISPGTVEKYAIYTRALEEIGKKEPKLVPKILSGKYKFSHNGVIELARLSQEEIKGVNRRLERTSSAFAPYQATRKEIHDTVMNAAERAKAKKIADQSHTVKDMPKYDPDSEVTGLTLTIPSWESSIKRVKAVTDLSLVSDDAKNKLVSALIDLKLIVDEMLYTVKEV